MSQPADTAIDLYCERSSSAFWAEPVNALTNLSFIVAALMLLVLLRRGGRQAGWPALLLTGNVAVIGVGSFLFHTFASRLTMLADLLPIFIYQLCFLGLYLRRIAGWRRAAVGGLLAAFLLVNAGFAQLPAEWLNGSLKYAGALLFIAALAALHRQAGRNEPNILWWASAIFLVALACRSLDEWLCPGWPLGTHFLWHLLNGLVLYLTTRAFIVNHRA
ncbi:MAG: ceramidase [Dechloromonas sp.]|nr:MAG: ceramidase [Dechloromonas sp.]